MREPGLLESQQSLNEGGVGRTDQSLLAETAFPLLRLFSQDMTFERLLVGDFASAGHLKSLLGTRVRLNLGHVCPVCMIPCWRIRTGGALGEPFG
jgi:hypothetical protein